MISSPDLRYARRRTVSARLVRALPVSLTSLLILLATLPGRGQDPVPSPTEDAPRSSPLSPITTALRENDVAKAAQLLKALDLKTLPITERTRYQRLSSLVALRTGDRAWLESITNAPDYPSTSIELMLITVARLMQDGKFDEARALVKQVPNPDALSDVPKRRYHALQARLAQFSGDTATERRYIALLVRRLAEWPSANCQGCHANPRKFGEQVTTFDAAGWWAGKRFSALVAGPNAERIVSESRKRLTVNPEDTEARLRLAYALQAQGKAKDAEAALRELPWAEFSDRERRTPLRLGMFP